MDFEIPAAAPIRRPRDGSFPVFCGMVGRWSVRADLGSECVRGVQVGRGTADHWVV